MGMLSRKSKPETVVDVPAKASKAPLPRNRLHFVAGEQAKAASAVADLLARIERLSKIIEDGDIAKAALQAAINEDGGLALAEYSAGRANDSNIAKLAMTEETATRAAAAAHPALAKAQRELEFARAEIIRLDLERQAAVVDYLKLRADEFARTYMQTVNGLFALHDAMVGISGALSAGDEHGEIVMSLAPISVPRFNLPSSADSNGEFLPTMSHHADEYNVRLSHGKWLKARNVLAENPDADIDSLIGPE